MKTCTKKSGFTLVEVVVTIGIVGILVGAVFGVYNLIINQIASYRDRTTVSYLAAQYMEIVRNMPYSKIGTLQGNPHGDLPDLPNALVLNFGGNDYKVYYVASYADDPADGTIVLGTDPMPTDYKQVKLYIENTRTGSVSDFVTNIAPQNLEGLGAGYGALLIKVIDSSGQRVPGATLHITNSSTSPTYDLTRLTNDADTDWVEPGLKLDITVGYHIIASKDGYSTDQTYPLLSGRVANNPDAMVFDGQVTSVTLQIDLESNLEFDVIKNDTCLPVSGVDMEVRGEKVSYRNPDDSIYSYKFDHNYTSNANGSVNLNNMEWDTYTPSLISSQYMIYGTSPIQQIYLAPDTSQKFSLMVGNIVPNSLLVIVKDASTGNAIEGAVANLQLIDPEYNAYATTGGSVQSQQSWAGGSGQNNFIDNSTKYFSDDGNVDISTLPAGLRLVKLGNSYVSSGYVISSTFDTGTDKTSYSSITWKPATQIPSGTIKFQIASNNDNETWNFTGPDGSASSYYTVSGTAIYSGNSNKRYVRYKVFLSTTDNSKTPVLTSVNINYVSGCYTPGQVIFAGKDPAGHSLVANENYVLIVQASGYETKTIDGLHIIGNQVLEVNMSPGNDLFSNSAPYFTTTPSDNGSSASNPTLLGRKVTFTSTATDAEGNQYYLAVCKLNSITPNSNSAPTCDTGSWCISSATNSGYQASCTYTTQSSDASSNEWYAFVCDKNLISSCASFSQGSGDDGSPFYVNPWLAGWNYRRKITISHTNVGSDLTDFPLLVKIAESSGSSTNIGANCLANGYDIRFTSSDGMTLLPYERETFSVSSNNLTANIWVKVPVISHTADTVIYMYYNYSP